MGVHVAHQHHVTVVGNPLTNVSQLVGTPLGAERQVHHDHQQRLFTLAKLGENSASAWQYARQFVIFQQIGSVTAEQPVGVLCKAPEVAI